MNSYFGAYAYDNNIEKHLPLVKRTVDQMSLRNSADMEYDDYINIGVIGLIDAISKYDSKKNVSFEGYAKMRIRGTIIDELRKNGKVSRYKISKLNSLYEAKRKLQYKLLRNPSDNELCDELNVNIDELNKIYETTHILSSLSLESTLYDDESETSLKDKVIDNNSLNPEDELLKDERKNELKNAIEKLSERDKILLNLYYEEELTLKEISEIFDVTVSRVSQLHGRAITKLRQFLTD